MSKKPQKRSLIFFCSICGFVFASWAFQVPRPAFCVFLQMPLVWFFKFIRGSQNVQHESLSDLVFIPIWFIYWTCLGALIGFILQSLFCFFKNRRKGANVAMKSEAIEQQPTQQWSGMNFVYLIGSLGLIIFFTLAKRAIHGWQPVGFVLLWLSIIGAISFPLLKFTRRFPPTKPYSDWCAIHAALETMPAVFLFSPTFVDFYMFGFPAPSTLTLLGLLFMDRKQLQGLFWINFWTAIISIICFWFVIWACKFIHQSSKLQPKTNKTSALIPVLCIIVIGTLLFSIVAYLLYRVIIGLQSSGP